MAKKAAKSGEWIEWKVEKSSGGGGGDKSEQTKNLLKN